MKGSKPAGPGLRILILEDFPSDAELMELELKGSGLVFTSRRVDRRSSFIRALKEFFPDLILSDYSLPSFDGLTALRIARNALPGTPFIFVSGALGEELAIELLRKGATDYVLKNRLSRLGPAVTRALQQVRDHVERRKAEEALRESERRYRAIFDNTGTATIIVDRDGLIELANREFERLTGWSRRSVEGLKNWTRFVLEEDAEKIGPVKQARRILAEDNFEIRMVDRRGEVHNLLITQASIPGIPKKVISLLDITDRKRVEASLQKREQELDLKTRSLEEANTALKVLLKRREEDKAALEENILLNVKKLVLPYVEKLKGLRLDEAQLAHVEIIDSHLGDIISPFLKTMMSQYMSLTPREIQIAGLVKDGRTTKEVTELLNISATAVDFHRKNIRMKFGIKNKKANLRSFLMSLSQ